MCATKRLLALIEVNSWSVPVSQIWARSIELLDREFPLQTVSSMYIVYKFHTYSSERWLLWSCGLHIGSQKPHLFVHQHHSISNLTFWHFMSHVCYLLDFYYESVRVALNHCTNAKRAANRPSASGRADSRENDWLHCGALARTCIRTKWTDYVAIINIKLSRCLPLAVFFQYFCCARSSVCVCVPVRCSYV